MTYRDALAALAAALPNLSARDAAFANSLLDQANKHYTYSNAAPLSQNQWHWVRKLAETKPAAATVDLSAIVSLFDNVSLKHPAIVFQAENGPAFRLSRAGAASSAPGAINVTDTTKSFDARVWFGRIGQDGQFRPSGKVAAETTTAVTAALVAFAANPAGQAAAYGHRTGNCCFCARDLTDPRSVRVGYGPICAGKWNLPWGE